MKQFDISTVFLYRSIDKCFYTTQIQDFEQKNGFICLLNMAFYGLVQNAHLWFGNLKGISENFNLTQSKHDNVLFYNTSWNLYITVYVDDINAFCPNDTTILILKEHL